MIDILYKTFYTYNTGVVGILILNFFLTAKLNIIHLLVSTLYLILNYSVVNVIKQKYYDKNVLLKINLLTNLLLYIGCSVLLDMLNSEHKIVYKWIMSNFNFFVLFLIAFLQLNNFKIN